MHRITRFLTILFLTLITLSSTGCASLVVVPFVAARELSGLAFDVAGGATKLSIQSTEGGIEVASAGVDLAGKIIKVAGEHKKLQVAQK